MKDHSVLDSGSSYSSVTSSVLERARNKDNTAFQRIVTLYTPLVYCWCRQAGLRQEDTEDVGQKVFLTVSRSLQGFRRDKPQDSFRGWLRVITRTRIADHRRETGQWESGEGGDSSWNPKAPDDESDNDSSGNRHAEIVMIVERMLAFIRHEFSEQDYQTFLLVVREEMAPKDVAAKLGISVNSVYLAKCRILKRLREEFGELLDDLDDDVA